MSEPSDRIRKPRVGIFWLPSLITCGSLMLAVYAITLAINGNYVMACILLTISAMLDLLDGLIARLTKSISDFGAHLDSLADMVAFGVAPALLAWLWGYPFIGNSMSMVAVLFTIMAALRLARFNGQLQDTEKKSYFQGLPSPAAASLVFSSIWLIESLSLDKGLVINPIHASIGLAIACAVGGLLMVSNIRYISVKHLGGRRIPFVGLLALLLGILLLVSQPALFLFVSAWLYSLFGVVYTLYLRRQRRIQKKLKQSATLIH